jgi:hypothetical protein
MRGRRRARRACDVAGAGELVDRIVMGARRSDAQRKFRPRDLA